MANGLAGLIAQPRIADIAGGQRQFEAQQQRNQLFAQQQAEQTRVGRARGLAGAALGGIPGVDQALAQADPSLALQVFEATGVAGEQRQAQFTEDVRIAAGLAQQNPQAAFESVQRAITRNEAAGIPSPEMRQFLEEFAADPVTGAQNLQQLNQALQVPLAQTAGQREFATTTAGFTEEEVAQAQRVRAGLRPRAGVSAAERIAVDPALSQQVAAAAGEEAGAREGAKLKKQLAFKPQIQRAVKLAEEKARREGETLTTLARAQAAMPGLLDTVDSLKELAQIATSTVGGKLFDTASRELGFGATRGSTARAKFIAVVANQVLPLLKDTFGAAFTVQEGESLKATMGDPDASPGEKIAQLEAFITQKQRSIATGEREVEAAAQQTTQPPEVIRFDRNGQRIQ